MSSDGPERSPSKDWEGVYESLGVDPSHDQDEPIGDDSVDSSEYVVEQFLDTVTPVHAPNGYDRTQDDCRFNPRYSRFRR